jgi:cytidylate kinase
MRVDKNIQAAQAYLVASARSRHSQSSEARHLRPFLTLSREAGAGAHSLAERLVDLFNGRQPELPWALFDDNLVHEVLRKHDLPKNLARYMSEDKVAEINEFLEVSLGLHPHKDVLVGKVNATIIALARMGHVILVGRGAHVLTRMLAGGVHVRLVASRERRRDALCRDYGLEPREAESRMDALDEGRRAYVRRHFNEDVTDALAYDMVINTTAQAIEPIATMLARRLQNAGGGRVLTAG